MGILQTEGFARLLADTAAEAARQQTAYDAVCHAVDIGGRLPPHVGFAALTNTEQVLFAALRDSGATLDVSGDERVVLTTTGRVRLLISGEAVPDGALPVGAIDWGEQRPDTLDSDLARACAADRDELAAAVTWLSATPADQVADMVTRLRETLRHVGPITVYIGKACYTNLGRQSNIVGKSIAADSPRCTLNRLAATAHASWSPEETGFLIGMSALFASGTPSRGEEFSGTQLVPSRLVAFIEERIRSYDGVVPPPEPGQSVIDRIFALACLSRELRSAKLARGPQIYRLVHAITIIKGERFLDREVTPADLPQAVREYVHDIVPDGAGDPGPAVEAWVRALPHAYGSTADGFSTGFEQVLHGIVEAATEAIGADAGMSRGPRDIPTLARHVAARDVEVGHWSTGAYYCCVVPSHAFVERFDAVPRELPQVVRAIAARMRWNCWHFMPSSAGVAEHHSFADRDWFFAPTMPDMTDWTSHHHQGHVANGVRHAIRVPFGVTIAAAQRPGLHDFRLMRTDGDPFAIGDLRAAIAVGKLLQNFYQAHASLMERGHDRVVIRDFDNAWYEQRYRRVVA